VRVEDSGRKELTDAAVAGDGAERVAELAC
jgi:hypothetical protein